jgi:hypothetical protein
MKTTKFDITIAEGYPNRLFNGLGRHIQLLTFAGTHFGYPLVDISGMVYTKAGKANFDGDRSLDLVLSTENL